MKCNVGKKDKKLRFWLGLGLLVVGHATKVYWLNLIGAIAWVTGYFEFCGLYKVLGMDTCEGK